jgi:hypothetical protein
MTQKSSDQSDQNLQEIKSELQSWKEKYTELEYK